MSLEQPNSPFILASYQQPKVEIQITIKTEQIAESVFEVTVAANVKAQIEDKIGFLLEVKQAGIFEIRNLPDDQMGPVVGISCPQIIYPYLRSNVAEVIQRAGFPPVHLSEFNFQDLYEQQQADSQHKDRNDVGELQDSKRSGFGTHVYADGSKYEGEFKDGMHNGVGIFTSDGSTYEGEFKDDQFNGRGTMTHPNGNKYIGEFKDGFRDGKGTLNFANGDKYIGEFKDGMRNGLGTLTVSDGSRVFAEWKDDEVLRLINDR
jgi:preprotein translocase subunit SecB